MSEQEKKLSESAEAAEAMEPAATEEKKEVKKTASSSPKKAAKKEKDKKKGIGQWFKEIKGEMKKIEWGSQIRSYVFQPYTLVKDHRTGAENGNIQAVMDGELEPFIHAYLVQS